MKPIALLVLAFVGVFAAMLVFAVVGQAVEQLRGPSSAELARRSAELARIDRAQQLDADLYWLDRLLAGAWRVVPLVAVVGALGFVAVRGVAYARFRRVYAEPSPAGLLPVELVQIGVKLLCAINARQLGITPRQIGRRRPAQP